MSNVAFVRNLDKMGRLVIPKEMRDRMEIAQGTPLAMFMDKESGALCLSKYEPGCVFCGKVTDDAIVINGKHVCRECARQAQTNQ